MFKEKRTSVCHKLFLFVISSSEHVSEMHSHDFDVYAFMRFQTIQTLQSAVVAVTKRSTKRQTVLFAQSWGDFFPSPFASLNEIKTSSQRTRCMTRRGKSRSQFSCSCTLPPLQYWQIFKDDITVPPQDYFESLPSLDEGSFSAPWVVSKFVSAEKGIERANI